MGYEQVCPLFSEKHRCHYKIDEDDCTTFYPPNYEIEDPILYNPETSEIIYKRDLVELTDRTEYAMSIIIEGLWTDDSDYLEYENYTELMIYNNNINVTEIWFNLYTKKFGKDETATLIRKIFELKATEFNIHFFEKYVIDTLPTYSKMTAFIMNNISRFKNPERIYNKIMSKRKPLKPFIDEYIKYIKDKTLEKTISRHINPEYKYFSDGIPEMVYHFFMLKRRDFGKLMDGYIKYIKEDTRQKTMQCIYTIECCSVLRFIPELLYDIIHKV